MISRKYRTRVLLSTAAAFCVVLISRISSATASGGETTAPPTDGTPLKVVLNVKPGEKNLLEPDRASPYEEGFRKEGSWFLCDNGSNGKGRRGVAFRVMLNQVRPDPIVATGWSKAVDVGGSPDSDYSVYIDLQYADGTQLYGQTAPFSTQTHGWEQKQVVILPEKPVASVGYYLLLRGHGGKAWFRDPQLQVLKAPAGSCRFDGVAVLRRGPSIEGFQVRNVAADSSFVRIEKEALGLKFQAKEKEFCGATFFDVRLTETTGKDRAVTLVYAVPLDGETRLRWFQDPRRAINVAPASETVFAGHFRAGADGRLSRYPLGAVESEGRGIALGIDMARPAFFRIGCNSGTEELFLAYDIGLTAEKPEARVRFCRYPFESSSGFRSALVRYYELFPEAFRCRTPEQGLWMPFTAISTVRGWEDFGFKFKEGNDETRWDDQHGILTFRYTEPMTWWMPLGKGVPRTWDAALDEATRLARNKNASAQALLTSGYYDERGRIPAQLLDTPWCNGAVWSMNSMPGIGGEVTHFKTKWNPVLREPLYGPRRKGDLDGEYIDSSEGYVTGELDFRRDHFASADTPLCFSLESRKPAIFRGLVAFEYAPPSPRTSMRWEN